MGPHGCLPENETCCAAHHQGALLPFFPFLPHAVCLTPMLTWAQCKNPGHDTDKRQLFSFTVRSYVSLSSILLYTLYWSFTKIQLTMFILHIAKLATSLVKITDPVLLREISEFSVVIIPFVW